MDKKNYALIGAVGSAVLTLVVSGWFLIPAVGLGGWYYRKPLKKMWDKKNSSTNPE